MNNVLRKAFLGLVFLQLSCAHFTVGRIDHVSPKEITKNSSDSKKYKFELTFGHSMWTDTYFASDTISDSIYLMDKSKQRDSALKSLNYWSFGGKTACGWRIINKMNVPDSSKLQIAEIDYKGIKYGKIGFEVKCIDTGYSNLVFHSIDSRYDIGIEIFKDTILIQEYNAKSFERSINFLPFLWLKQLWPFWPAF